MLIIGARPYMQSRVLQCTYVLAILKGHCIFEDRPVDWDVDHSLVAQVLNVLTVPSYLTAGMDPFMLTAAQLHEF